MKSKDIRSKFINYFENQGHSHVGSSSLVPEGDATLLFTNAGMNQFKNTFLGIEQRDCNRAVSSQKCVRAGGKHNDLENVGRTARHQTFFEMLGNFSFGDYFKKEAIHYAWEFITKDLGIDKALLYVTVFETDDEAADIWHKQEGVAKDRIYRFGEKDNFWRMGDTGPCGPCSEIFIDLGPGVGGDPKQNVMGGEGDRFMEFWNLVFMQYNEDETGKQTPLPKPSVDTGMGLERLSTILQGELSNYHTDLFMALIGRAVHKSGVQYLKTLDDLSPDEKTRYNETNVALRVLADHARAGAFLIADGVLPSNDGRGYVLRRILRRAVRFGKKLSERSLLPEVVNEVIVQMNDFFPELKHQQKLIESTIQDEESRFLQTLDQGIHLLNDQLSQLKNKGQTVLAGETVFKLYDTYGFPVDLTRLMSEEQGLHVDEKGFEEKMNEARQKAKASWKGKAISGNAAHFVEFSQAASGAGETEFVGYTTTRSSGSKITALSNGDQQVEALKAGDEGVIVLDKTPFYAEGGGQVGDVGKISTPKGTVEVLDCTKQSDVFLHHVKVTDGEVHTGETADAQVTDSDRRSTANNHSATHLMHSALREILGDHVQQAGSLVDPERLRFDFTHNKPLSRAEIVQIESWVNQEISASYQVQSDVIPRQQALDEGAMALFGEKYASDVRVITMGPKSKELCGGTHVENTAHIRVFKIVSESGVSSGVRRIEALTGDRAAKYLMKNAYENQEAREATGINEGWTAYLNSEDTTTVAGQVEALKSQIKDYKKEVQKLKGSNVNIDSLVSAVKAFSFNGAEGKLVLGDIPMDDRKVLGDLSTQLTDKIGSGVVVLLGQGEQNHPLIVSVSKDLLNSLKAGAILKEIAESLGGKGGGRPDFAQGAVPDRSMDKAFAKAESLVGL
jgi:alanyl-tRNA synthetase